MRTFSIYPSKKPHMSSDIDMHLCNAYSNVTTSVAGNQTEYKRAEVVLTQDVVTMSLDRLNMNFKRRPAYSSCIRDCQTRARSNIYKNISFIS